MNVAADLDGKPRRSHDREEARKHALTADEARNVLRAAKKAGPQSAVFYALALNGGMRKVELCGLELHKRPPKTLPPKVLRIPLTR